MPSKSDISQGATLPAGVEALCGRIEAWPVEIRALVAALPRRVTPSTRRQARKARRCARHPFSFSAVLSYDHPERGTQKLTVYTRDQNGTHVGFISDVLLTQGQLVELDFTTLPETQSLGRIACRVRRCRQFQEGWFDCVAQVGATARRPVTLWGRLRHWIGETTGFGPDDHRGQAGRRGRAA